MSENEEQVQQTQHAFLVIWGEFASEIGLIKGIEGVKLKQKTYQHTPQAKVLEMLVAIMGGTRYLQDISLSAHPLDKDKAVAQSWGQPGWADYSGVSRTMSSLSWEEALSIVAVFEKVSQPFLETELTLIRKEGERLQIDGDLTGIPVSNTSKTYPNAAFGHMDDDIRLGYQAGVVSIFSPTYGRLWLSGMHHPGNTVSSTQAEALILEAEAKTHLRPLRRTDLLEKRISDHAQTKEPVLERLATQQSNCEVTRQRLIESQTQRQERLIDLECIEQIYQARNRPERPTSRLALQRKRCQAAQRRCLSREKALQSAQRKLVKTQSRLEVLQSEAQVLQQRLERFRQDNAANDYPIETEFRLDAGFGSYHNIALLIEMGYEAYTKPFNHQVIQYLRNKVQDTQSWTRVGNNAEMIAWPDLQLKGCPYPLNVALEHFYTGKTRKHGVLCHFGTDPVTQDLPAWFAHYNGRQTIEAGIKEGKQVFHLHRIKVRSEPAIFLQERMVLFAANFIRWAALWLAERSQPDENALDILAIGIKRQVHVGAHVSAQVIRNSEGVLLKFSEFSAFAGKVLILSKGGHPPFCRQKF